MCGDAISHCLPCAPSQVSFRLFSSEITDKGFVEFMKTMGRLEKLKELKLNLMNN